MFRSFRPASFAEKVLGAISRFMCPKTKLFPVKFRRMWEVFGLQVLQKKFWAQFSIYVYKNKAVSREIQTYVTVFSLQVLQRKFWV